MLSVLLEFPKRTFLKSVDFGPKETLGSPLKIKGMFVLSKNQGGLKSKNKNLLNH